MDALCKRSEAFETDPFLTTISDAAIVQTVLPWCKFGRGISSGTDHLELETLLHMI